MKKELIVELFQKFEQACYLIEGTECWSARELQTILGYAEWRNFLNAIEKAKNACEGAGEMIQHHFADVNKMVELGSGSQRRIEDFALTRYACYLIAQNGDPTKKSEIAFAQTYFAVQTRRQEIIEQRLLDLDRVTAREKLSKTENKLSGILFERGVDEAGFAIIRSEGDKALFGGRTTQDMKRKLSVPDTRPLADFLPTLTIKAKDFAAELTHHNVVEKDMYGQPAIQREHVDNNLAVRKILRERGVKPEALPPAEDVKKVERRLKMEDKKALQKPEKIKTLLKKTKHALNMTKLTIQNTITIDAPASKVWDALTNPEQTKKYMFGCETVSEWQVGSPLLWRMEYEGKELIAVKGSIVEIKPEHFLAYTVFDPNTAMEDIPENYLTVTYSLTSENDQTVFTVTQGDYATVADGERRYQESYNNGEGWNPILVEIKKLVEAG